MSLYPVQKSFKSLGQTVIESRQFKEAKGSHKMEKVQVEAKDLLESNTGGLLVQPQLIAPIQQRGLLGLVELLPVVPVVSNLVRLPVENPGQSVADAVAEGALKPERDSIWSLGEFRTFTLAQWIAASRQILEDSGLLRSYIDVQLKREVLEKLDELIIRGTGVNQILGILATPNIQTRTHQVASGGMGAATDSIWQTLSYAMADLRLKKFNPDMIALSPQLLASLDPTTVAAVNILGVTIASDTNLAATEGLVMDSRFSPIFLRNESAIWIGQPQDYFLKNLIAILCELRAGFGVTAPQSVVKVSFA